MIFSKTKDMVIIKFEIRVELLPQRTHARTRERKII
jgi:hypothetical protein